jgi:glycosyltransferase involved in cell wall biosynthesis
VTVLLFNQRVDLDDPGQGVAIDWMLALAARVERLIVITHHAGRLPQLPNGVIYSMGRERGWSEPRRALTFYRLLARALWTARPAFCLAHMVPVSTLMAGPVLRAKGIPILQWYTHRGTPWELRVATRFARHVLTATADSFRLDSPKVIVTGHGIPTERFTPGPARAPNGTYRVLTVGRLSPIKNVETILQAIALLRQRGMDVSLRIVGAARVAEDVAYERRLKEAVRALDLADAVAFSGPMDRDSLVDVYRQADVFVHACDSGLDKAGLEAMSCGVPLVSSSTGFRELLEMSGRALTVSHGDPAALASRLQDVREMPDAERRDLGLRLRALVEEHHDMSRLIERIIALGASA